MSCLSTGVREVCNWVLPLQYKAFNPRTESNDLLHCVTSIFAVFGLRARTGKARDERAHDLPGTATCAL